MASRTRTRAQATAPRPPAIFGPDQIIQVPIGDIRPYPNNPRDNAAAIDAVAASINDFGFRVPILLDAEYTLIAGHTRVEAAKKLGLEHVPAMFGTDMTPEQIKAFRLVDNKTAELASWDNVMLAGEIVGLQEFGIDLASYGFAEDELASASSVVAEFENSGGGLDDTPPPAPAAQEPSPGRTRTVSADPQSTRIQIGEFTFYLTVAAYRAWAGDLMTANGHDKNRVLLELASRLGIREQVEAHGVPATEEPSAAGRVVRTRVMGTVSSAPTPQARTRVRTA